MGAGDLKRNPGAISDNDQEPKGSAANLTTVVSGKGGTRSQRLNLSHDDHNEHVWLQA